MCFSNISVGIQPQSLHWTVYLIVWPQAHTAKLALQPTETKLLPTPQISTHCRDSEIMIPGWASEERMRKRHVFNSPQAIS